MKSGAWISIKKQMPPKDRWLLVGKWQSLAWRWQMGCLSPDSTQEGLILEADSGGFTHWAEVPVWILKGP
jgi:hypothetical protein